MVITKEEKKVQKLLPKVKGCTSKTGTAIFAKQLTKAVKLYTVWDGENYMYGRPGDYLAVRPDDPTDVYVIRQRIFEKTYESV